MKNVTIANFLKRDQANKHYVKNSEANRALLKAASIAMGIENFCIQNPERAERYKNIFYDYNDGVHYANNEANSVLIGSMLKKEDK